MSREAKIQERNYLLRRIEEIKRDKEQVIRKDRDEEESNTPTYDEGLLLALIAGKVRFKSMADIKVIHKNLRLTKSSYNRSVDWEDLLSGVEKYKEERAKADEERSDRYNLRHAKLDEATTLLKDKIMLGDLPDAIKQLEDLAKMKF
ncbi:MAG: hypothetical protein WC479_05755 [Candidatus Izemoplasmatales bacterium]